MVNASNMAKRHPPTMLEVSSATGRHVKPIQAFAACCNTTHKTKK
jgi:hypothetical protein